MNGDTSARLSVVILTFNPERTIGAPLARALHVVDDLYHNIPRPRMGRS
jgi:hypothetical protein